MWLRIFFFVSILFCALALGAAISHVMALPQKIYLSEDDYFAVQQIYKGWTLLGVGLFVSIISTLVLAFMVIRKRAMFFLTLAAFLCLAGSVAVFWIFTYPVNKITFNWTVQPENWETLRQQWEYSHAAGAALDLAALVLLLLVVLKPYKNNDFLYAKPIKKEEQGKEEVFEKEQKM